MGVMGVMASTQRVLQTHSTRLIIVAVFAVDCCHGRRGCACFYCSDTVPSWQSLSVLWLLPSLLQGHGRCCSCPSPPVLGGNC
jgi:hypothetical protein